MAANNICKSLDVFNKHISVDDTQSLHNPMELHHYLIACIVSLPRIKFQSSSSSSSSSSLSLAFVMYTSSARLLYATRCWEAF
jgi:hypothetical protein